MLIYISSIQYFLEIYIILGYRLDDPDLFKVFFTRAQIMNGQNLLSYYKIQSYTIRNKSGILFVETHHCLKSALTSSPVFKCWH